MNRAPGAPLTPSEAFWQLLGARPSEAVHVHIATPTIVFFGTSTTVAAAASSVTRSSYAALKYVGLPISLTTFALWIFLHQLLKGKAQLDTDGHSFEREDKVIDDANGLQHPAIECYLPETPRASDIEVLACNRKATIYASWVPVEQQIIIASSKASSESGPAVHISLTNVLSKGENIAALALTDSGEYCAAATTFKRILFWQVKDNTPPLDIVTVKVAMASRAVALFAERQAKVDGSPPKAGSASVSSVKAKCAFYSLHQDGSLMRWDCHERCNRVSISPAPLATRSAVLHSGETSQTFVIRYLLSSEVEIWRNEGEQFRKWRTCHTGEPASDITVQAFCILGAKPLLALGKASGTIELWDIQEQSRVHSSHPFQQSIRTMHLISLIGMRCPTCGVAQCDSVILAATSSSSTHLFRLSAASSDSCECKVHSPSLTPSGSSLGLGVGSPGTWRSPSPRSLSEDPFNNRTLSYPLSPHAFRRPSRAIHSDDIKKAEEPTHKYEGSQEVTNNKMHAPGDVSFEHLRETSDSKIEGSALEIAPLPWRTQLYGRIKTDEKGTWDVCGNTLIGIRRSADAHGGGVLAKWEVWTCRLDRPIFHHDGTLAVQAATLKTMLSSSPSSPPRELVAEAHSRNSSFSSRHRTSSPHVQLPFDKIKYCITSQKGQAAVVVLGNLVATLRLEDVSLAMRKSPSAPYTR